MRCRTMIVRCIIGLTAVIQITVSTSEKPNLIIIMTDEHNVRTLGCYQSVRSEPFLSEPLIWGEGVKVNTPNIDSLAKDGALFTNFNSVAPLCTPSRASFMSGLYPKFTGASENRSPMNEDVVTFAQILQEKENYATGYVGKWHLNGDEKPGFSNEERRFGFSAVKYQFNRGHYKLFEENTQTGETHAYDWKDRKKLKGNIQDAYATDFLFRKGIEFIERKIKKRQHFALMLSIPDPHGPNDVRAPYDTMYDDMNFTLPSSAVAAYHKRPALPRWSKAKIQTNLETANETIKSIENSDKWQKNMRNYFGMVKLIDKKVGELLLFLKESGQEENTIVVFTSDHGDMMGEHASYNKGTPYLGSVGVPFLIRYPGHIREHKIIKTAYSSPDFAPTILSLMGVDHTHVTFHGIDGSNEILSSSFFSRKKQSRFIIHPKEANWVAVVDRHYKLVLGRTGEPWLFDLNEDPHEIINYAADPSYTTVMDKLQDDLLNAMEKYKLPLANKRTIYMDQPTCYDTNDQIPDLPYHVCNDIKKDMSIDMCDLEEVRNFCANACGTCCEDSPGHVRHKGELRTCSDFVEKQWYCQVPKISGFCPLTCLVCTPAPSSRPSISQLPTVSSLPSNAINSSPTTVPSIFPTISPTGNPSTVLSIIPTGNPSAVSSSSPSDLISIIPTGDPSAVPSSIPTDNPSTVPSSN